MDERKLVTVNERSVTMKKSMKNAMVSQRQREQPSPAPEKEARTLSSMFVPESKRLGRTPLDIVFTFHHRLLRFLFTFFELTLIVLSSFTILETPVCAYLPDYKFITRKVR